MSIAQQNQPINQVFSDPYLDQTDNDVSDQVRTSNPVRISLEFGIYKLVFEIEPSILNKISEPLSRIKSFGKLGYNWDFYGAESISPISAYFAVSFLDFFVRQNILIPAVVPTTKGGIQLEWHTRGIDCEIEILTDGNIEFYSYELSAGNEVEKHYPVNSIETNDLINLLQTLKD